MPLLKRLEKCCVAVFALISGCAVSTPQRQLGDPAESSAQELVYVVVTQADVKPRMKGDFRALADGVAKTLPHQPGLLSFSLRGELLGSKAWTLTVWATRESRDAFGESPEHRAAMKLTPVLVNNFAVRRFEVRRSELPLRWHDVLQRFEQPA